MIKMYYEQQQKRIYFVAALHTHVVTALMVEMLFQTLFSHSF